jgi:uncharacterized membrane protein YfcA
MQPGARSPERSPADADVDAPPPEVPRAAAERPAAWFVPAGALIGFAGALCGIGGGLFAGPLLHATRGLALRRAAATALLVVLATTVSATATELARAEPALDWAVVVPLALGALLGAQLGFIVAQRTDERRLKLVFAVVLLLAGLRLLVAPAPVAGGLELGPSGRACAALAIGVLGGMLTPLLGVAGGLFMVPALFFTLDGLGFGGARAASLAAGAVGAVRLPPNSRSHRDSVGCRASAVFIVKRGWLS